MSTDFEDLIGRSNTAGKPAASIPGRLWFDTTLGKLQRDNGATWDDVESTVSSGLPVDGWVVAAAMTYASADDPTFTATMVGDVSGTYGLGMRIKLTQATGGTKYFIITKIAVSGDTTLTLYGGSDYNLNNEAISDPYYSIVKAPFGFPLNPTKWTEEYNGGGAGPQADPVDGTWYNLGGSLSIPIGVWKVEHMYLARATSTSYVVEMQCTLSDANNTAGSATFTLDIWSACFNGTHQNVNEAFIPGTRTGILALTTKATYYGNIKEDWAADTSAFSMVSNIIRAVCAYL
jgi:hypothetical protein